MSDEDYDDFDDATCCHICKKKSPAKTQEVRCHENLTGKYRGASHKNDDINYFNKRYLPVFFHNL